MENPTSYSASERSRIEAALRRIEQLGGTVVWERDLCAVTLAGVRISDDDLALFHDLACVQMLSLSNTGITDTGLSHLYGMHQLETLSLTGTKVTPVGIDRLCGVLPRVQVISTPPKQNLNPFTGKPFAD